MHKEIHAKYKNIQFKKIFFYLIERYSRPKSPIIGGSEPHGIHSTRPITIKKNPPHNITLRSANL